MDRTLVVGASGGIGGAIVERLREGGSEVTAQSRREHGLDLTCEASVADVFSSLKGPYRRIIVATGALEIGGVGPEKAIRQASADALVAQFTVNAVGPLLVLKHALRLMPRRERSVFCALSARVGSIGDNRSGGWYGYRASKAGLNQLIHSASIEVARTHPQAICACLHPGTVDTGLTRPFRGKNPAVLPREAAANILSVIDGLTPVESGGFFDWRGNVIPW